MWPKKKPKNDHSDRTRAELEAFTEQAKWLIEYHDKRGDSFTARATALLGFSGVILALLLRGTLPEGVTYTCGVQIAGTCVIALLLFCAILSLLTLAPGSASAPGIDELRTKWKAWTRKKGRGKTLGDIADSYLMAHPTSTHIPVVLARQRATWRARFFLGAASAMLGALVALSVLLTLVYQQLR